MFEKKVTDEEKKRLEKEAKKAARAEKRKGKGDTGSGKGKALSIAKTLVIPAIVAAILVCVIYVAIDSKASAEELKTEVVCMKVDAAENTFIKPEELSVYFEILSVEMSAVSSNAYQSLSELPKDGFYIENDMSKSQMVYRDDISTVDAIMDKYKNGYEITSFQAQTFAGGVNGSLRRGDDKYYGFSFDDKKIYSEYLYHWPNGRETLIFSRENDEYEFRENVNEQITLSNRTPENKLYLVSSNDWNLPQTENAYKWFLEKLTFLMEEEPATSETVAQIVSGDDKKARILKELLLADLGITDVTIKNLSGKNPTIMTTHRILREDESVEYFQLSMDQESAGTQHFFARIGGWLQALENGALLVVDEIEDSLHPLLTKRLVEMVQDKTVNTNGAQLLFTTHDAMLLDLDFFRRDQIWFAEKDDRSCATELFPLTSFSPRKGENVRRGYLKGRFGAIPFIGGDVLWQK